MLYSIYGTVSTLFKDCLVLDTEQFGFLLYVSNPKVYQVNNKYKFYLYKYIHDDYSYYVGFSDQEEKSFFLKLISVKGLGPKTALKIIKNVDFNTFNLIVQNKDINSLCKIPGISKKQGLQIILDLETTVNDEKENRLVVEALEKMGFKRNKILSALSKIDNTNLEDSELIKSVLNILRG